MQPRHTLYARDTKVRADLFRFDGSLDVKAVRAAVPSCLRCGYDLRGISGLTPSCPECGLEHDLPRIIARLSVGRELGRRMMDALSIPIGWLVIMLIAMGGWASVTIARSEFAAMEYRIAAVWALLIAVGWVLLLRWADRRAVVGGGFGAALLLHVVFLGYLVGPLMVIVSMLLLFVSIVEGPVSFAVPRIIAGLPGADTITWTLHTLIGAGIWWGTVQLHRLILARCVTTALVLPNDEPGSGNLS